MASFFSPESHPDLWGNHSLHHPFLTWDNALIMMIITLIYLQLNITTRYLEQYGSIWMPLAVYQDVQWIKSDMCEIIMIRGFAKNTMSTTWSWKAIWQWWCVSHNGNGWNLYGNVSRNGYGNAIIGRYGGCFEEGIWCVYDTDERCAVLERLAMVEGWECVYSMDSTLVIKNSHTYCKNLLVIETKYYAHAPRGIDW